MDSICCTGVIAELQLEESRSIRSASLHRDDLLLQTELVLWLSLSLGNFDGPLRKHGTEGRHGRLF